MAGLSLTISGLHRTFGPEPAHYLDVARAAEDAGFAQVVLADHVVMGERTDRYPYGEFPMDPSEPWNEPLTILAAIAASTSRVRLGTGILIAPLRSPALLAKIVATLDSLSGGRVDLGVGVGWQREEYEAVGVPFGDRWDLLDDGLRRCRRLWAGEDEVVCEPRPVQDRLPVWLGAKCTEENARRVADWGDGWMPLEATTGADDLRDGIARLQQAFVDAGRDPNDLLVRAGLPVVRADPGIDWTATMSGATALSGEGVTHFSVNLRRSVASAGEAADWLGTIGEAARTAGLRS